MYFCIHICTSPSNHYTAVACSNNQAQLHTHVSVPYWSPDVCLGLELLRDIQFGLLAICSLAYMTESGCGNPKIFGHTSRASGWTPLSKFLNPPLLRSGKLFTYSICVWAGSVLSLANALYTWQTYGATVIKSRCIIVWKVITPRKWALVKTNKSSLPGQEEKFGSNGVSHLKGGFWAAPAWHVWRCGPECQHCTPCSWPGVEQGKEETEGRKRRKKGGTDRKNDEVLSISGLKSVSDTLRRMYKPFPFLSSPFFNLFLRLFLSYIPFLGPTNGLIARLVEHGIGDEDHTLDGE